MKVYLGVLIERTHTSFRWIALIPGRCILRADTLNGMKRLIRSARQS